MLGSGVACALRVCVDCGSVVACVSYVLSVFWCRYVLWCTGCSLSLVSGVLIPVTCVRVRVCLVVVGPGLVCVCVGGYACLCVPAVVRSEGGVTVCVCISAVDRCSYRGVLSVTCSLCLVVYVVLVLCTWYCVCTCLYWVLLYLGFLVFCSAVCGRCCCGGDVFCVRWFLLFLLYRLYVCCCGMWLVCGVPLLGWCVVLTWASVVWCVVVYVVSWVCGCVVCVLPVWRCVLVVSWCCVLVLRT